MAVDMSDLVAALDDWVQRAFLQATTILRDEVRGLVPTNRSEDGHDPASGPALVDTESFEPYSLDPPEYRASLAYTSDHASYTDEDTVPHEIHGVPWLVFKVGDRKVFLNNDLGKFVHHPGTTGTRWWSDHVDLDNWWVALSEALNDVAPPT